MQLFFSPARQGAKRLLGEVSPKATEGAAQEALQINPLSPLRGQLPRKRGSKARSKNTCAKARNLNSAGEVPAKPGMGFANST